MKYSFFALLTLLACFSCKNNSTTDPNAGAKDAASLQADSDLSGISDAIHNFYTFVEANESEVLNLDYVVSGKSTTLDPVKLDAYFARLAASGSIGKAYIDSERAYLKNLEATAWKNEDASEQPLTGLDYSRLFCAQDWDINFWKTGTVTTTSLGTDKVLATMTGLEAETERTQQFEMVKENDKWMIAKIICE